MPTPIKVILYCFGFFLVLEGITLILGEFGFKEKPRQQFSEQVKKNRSLYEKLGKSYAKQGVLLITHL